MLFFARCFFERAYFLLRRGEKYEDRAGSPVARVSCCILLCPTVIQMKGARAAGTWCPLANSGNGREPALQILAEFGNFFYSMHLTMLDLFGIALSNSKHRAEKKCIVVLKDVFSRRLHEPEGHRPSWTSGSGPGSDSRDPRSSR